MTATKMVSIEEVIELIEKALAENDFPPTKRNQIASPLPPFSNNYYGLLTNERERPQCPGAIFEEAIRTHDPTNSVLNLLSDSN